MSEIYSMIQKELNIDQEIFDSIISDESAKQEICEALYYCLENVPKLKEISSALLQYITFEMNDSRNDDEDHEWITVNGTHVPLDNKGRITGKVAEKINETSNKKASVKPVTSGWKEKNKKAREEHKAQDDGSKAADLCDLYGTKHGEKKFNDILKAFKEGNIDEEVDRYYDLMEKNGDPTPSKPTVSMTKGFSDKVSSEYGGDWEKARRGEFESRSGLSGEEADKVFSSLRKWVGSGWASVDHKDLDTYIESAPTYDGQLFRGLSFDDDRPGGFDDFISKIEVGGTMKMLGPASWASDEDTARHFAHSGDSDIDSVVIKCLKNRTATPIDFMNFQGENECLSPSSASWTVMDVQKYTSGDSKKAIITVVEKGE